MASKKPADSGSDNSPDTRNKKPKKASSDPEADERRELVDAYLQCQKMIASRPATETPEAVTARVERLQKRKDKLQQDIEQSAGVKTLQLIQKRKETEDQLEQAKLLQGGLKEISEAESKFVAIAKQFSEENGVTYEIWREAGVLPKVLRKAGIAKQRQL